MPSEVVQEMPALRCNTEMDTLPFWISNKTPKTLLLSTRFVQLHQLDCDFPPGRMEHFSLIRVYVSKLWQQREFFTALCVEDIISQVAKIQFCSAVAEVKQGKSR